MLNPNGGYPEGYKKISREGALLIWSAYVKMWSTSTETMDRRERRGGIAYTSEIAEYIEKGYLPKDFDWTIYLVQ